MESDNGKKVLITGGAGYVGQVLLQNIPDSWKTTVIDNVYVGNQDFSPNSNVEFVKGDIRNESLMEELITKNDAVIHLAGIVGDSCPKNPKSAEEVNVDATEKIAKFKLTASSIISIDIIVIKIFFRFNTNPNNPIKNKLTVTTKI